MRRRLFFTTAVAVITIVVFAVFIVEVQPPPVRAQGSGGTIELVGEIGGSSNIVVEGDYAYVVDNSRLKILDVSDPNTPKVIGKTDRFTGNQFSISGVIGSYVYLYIDSKLNIVDVSSPAAISVVGESDITIYANAIKGNYGYTTSNQGLGVIDLTNPSSPTIIKEFSIDNRNGYNGIFVVNDYLYVKAGYCTFFECYKELYAFDISNPTNPVNPLIVYNLPSETTLEISEVSDNYLYSIASGNKGYTITAMDVSNPISLTLAGTVDVSPNDIAIMGNYAYATSNDGLQIIDISIPADMLLVDTLPAIETGQLDIQNNQLYLSNGDGLTIYDITPPSTLVEQGAWKKIGINNTFVVSNNYQYSIESQCKLQVMDISDIDNPTIISHSEPITDLNNSCSIRVDDNYIYMNKRFFHTEKGTFHVLDISDPANVNEVGNLEGISNGEGFVVEGEYAYFSARGNSQGIFTIVDISDPTSPSVASSLTMSFQLNPTLFIKNLNLSISGNYAYMLALDTDNPGLYIIDVSDPSNPVEVGFFGGEASNLVAKDNYVYLTTGNLLRIVDVSDPTNPTRVGVYTIQGENSTISGAKLEGDFAYLRVSNSTKSLRVLDITNPIQPVEVATYGDSGANVYYDVHNGYIYKSSGSGILTVLRFTGAATQPTPTATPTQPADTPTPTATQPAATATSMPTNTPTTAPTQGFQVSRDGLSFDNFKYYGANWEQFKKAFPNTEMELTDGSRRKVAQHYFKNIYSQLGIGGNCAGFTAVSLIRYLDLNETVELDILSAEHRSIENAYDLPPVSTGNVSVGESDVKDYIHLYQTRQVSTEFFNWWDEHGDDTPVETFQAIKEITEAGEPVAVSIRQKGGHRMTAYRTEQEGNMGYIYVYDSNHPDDNNRRIEVNLSTGVWTYNIVSGLQWINTKDLRYSPASMNFPASIDRKNTKSTLLPLQDSGDIALTAVGNAQILIVDEVGNKFGYENGEFVNEITGAALIWTEAFNPENPNAEAEEFLIMPENSNLFTVTIQPITNSGRYTLTGFGDNLAFGLNNVAIVTDTNNSVVVNDSLSNTAFQSMATTDYCHYLAKDITDNISRDFTTCVTDTSETSIKFELDNEGQNLAVQNDSSNTISLTTTIDQVGDNSGSTTVSQQVSTGETTVISADGSPTIYLPILTK